MFVFYKGKSQNQKEREIARKRQEKKKTVWHLQDQMSTKSFSGCIVFTYNTVWAIHTTVQKSHKDEGGDNNDNIDDDDNGDQVCTKWQ